MKSLIQMLMSGAAVLGLSLAAGCAAGDVAEPVEGAPATEVAELETTQELGTLEEGLTSVNDVDCSICEAARQCCNAVSASSGCNNFDAARCATLDPGRQKTTKINCLVQLRTTISAWRLGGRTPPAACRIPGE